jgi:hypothetical protein
MSDMRTERWVLLATTLAFASGLGCSSDAPTTPKAEDDDGQVTESVKGEDDEKDPLVKDAGKPPATGSKDAGPSAVKDATADTVKEDAAPAAIDDAGEPAETDAGADPAPTGGGFPAAESADKDGPFKPTHITNGGPKGSSWVFYPMDIGKDGLKHPIFNWGPGAGTGPSQYTDHLNRLASHGFVVISQPSSGTGADEIPALDWLIAQNDKSGSPFYQKLDTKKVGAGGHSKGALTTMAMAEDPRLSLYVLVCGGGSGGAGAADIHGPTVILGGDDDIGTPNFEGDYKEIKSPVAFVTKSGTDHIACARNNLSPWVAFMRWNFFGEEKWKPAFFEGGEYCKSPWICKSKNY